MGPSGQQVIPGPVPLPTQPPAPHYLKTSCAREAHQQQILDLKRPTLRPPGSVASVQSLILKQQSVHLTCVETSSQHTWSALPSKYILRSDESSLI